MTGRKGRNAGRMSEGEGGMEEGGEVEGRCVGKVKGEKTNNNDKE